MLPNPVGVAKQPLVATLRGPDLVQVGGVVGQPESPLPEGSDEHPCGGVSGLPSAGTLYR